MDLLRKVKRKDIDPSSLGVAERRLMVTHLMAEGYSTAEMAEIFRKDDRTIQRDKRAVYESNALNADPKLVGITVGRLASEADAAIQHMRKVARDKNTPPAVKVEADRQCYQVFSDYVQRLQSLGYLPTAAQKVAADVTHRTAEVPGYSEMRLVVEGLMEIAPQEAEKLKRLQAQIVKAELADNIVEVSSTIQTKGHENEESK